MTVQLLAFGLFALVVAALVYAAKRWGALGERASTSKKTTESILRITKGGSNARETANSIPDSKLDDELRKRNLLREND